MVVRNKGFTLIELVLVIALLIISVGVSTDIIISLIRSYNKTQVTNEIEQSANFVMLKIDRDLRNAVSVTVPSNVGVGSDVLTFSDRNGDTISYQLSGDTIERSVNGGGSTALTDNSPTGGGVVASCTSGCFTLWNVNPQVIQVNIDFAHVGAGGSFFTGNVNMDSTVVIRGSY